MGQIRTGNKRHDRAIVALNARRKSAAAALLASAKPIDIGA